MEWNELSRDIDIAEWEGLPAEDLWMILLTADYKTILNACATSSRARAFCNDKRFWLNKLEQDYPDVTYTFTPSKDEMENAKTVREFYVSLAEEYGGRTFNPNRIVALVRTK